MNVLIAEDNTQLNIAISEFFILKGFVVVSTKNGLDAIDKIDKEKYDLYILDINIPRINGLDLLKYIRKTDLDSPIIIITASLEIENLAMAFENGCSEYIKKPFHLKELDIRINNLLSFCTPETITLRDALDYDFNKEEFLLQNKPIKLRYKEKIFCALLMKNIDSTVSNEMIYDYVWRGEARETYPLRQLLVQLRKKLPFDIIKTKVREGYMIETQK